MVAHYARALSRIRRLYRLVPGLPRTSGRAARALVYGRGTYASSHTNHSPLAITSLTCFNSIFGISTRASRATRTRFRRAEHGGFPSFHRLRS